MAIAVNDILRISANFQWAAQDFFTNVWHFKAKVNTTLTDTEFMVGMAAQIDAWYQILNVDISLTLNYLDIGGINVTQDVLLPTVGWPVLVNGSDAAQALPTQVAPCVFWRTLRPRTRTSKFLPGYTENSNGSGGVVGAGALVNLLTFGNAALLGVVQPNVEAEYGAYNKALNRFTPVDSAQVPARYRTQRRRRIGVGT